MAGIQILDSPKRKRWMGAPNLLLYYWACALQHYDTLYFLQQDTTEKAQIPTIFQLIYGQEAEGLIQRQSEKLYDKRSRYTIIRGVVKIWDQITRHCKIARYNKYTSLWYSDLLPTTTYDRMARNWERAGLVGINDIYNKQEIMEFIQIAQKYGLNKTSSTFMP